MDPRSQSYRERQVMAFPHRHENRGGAVLPCVRPGRRAGGHATYPVLAGSLAAMIVLAACASSGGSNAPVPELAGTWVLNEAESQRPDSAAQAAGRGRQPAARGGAGSVIEGRGGAGRGEFPGGGARGVAPGRMQAVMRHLTLERRGMTVKQTADSVVFTFADDFPIRYRANGKKEKRTLPGLGDVEVKADLKDGLLIIERKLEDDVRIRDEFVRGPGSSRLIVHTTVSGLGPREFTFRTVYDLDTG